MTTRLSDFQRLTRVFDPLYRSGKDALARLGSYYVPEAHGAFRHQLETALLLNENGKFLIAGQPGCGKTTLLLTITERLRSEGRPVAFVDLEVMAAVQDLGLAELHLAAAAELLREAAARQLTVSPATLNLCADWLRNVSRPDLTQIHHPEVLADNLVSLLKAARESAELRNAMRVMVAQGADRDPYNLMVAVLRDLESRQPVVIIDGLDKLPPEQARDFFLSDKRKPMADAPGAAIVTIPLSLVYEPTYNNLSERYNNADNTVLPAIRLWEFDEKGRKVSRSKDGFAILQEFVGVRIKSVDSELVMKAAVERAIESSGGNLRELGRVMQASIVKAVVQDAERIEAHHVDAAIADQRESYRRTFQPKFLPVLLKVRDQFQLDNVDDVGKLLLYGLWVTEYRNGITWYYLPMPVRQLVDHLEGSAERAPK